MTKKIVSGEFDHRTALICAEFFKRLSGQFIDNIGKIPEGSFRESPRELGDLVSSATNLALALEIYLKVLRNQFKSPIPKIHDLSKLYNDLPLKVRREIEDIYDRDRYSLPNRIHASITVAKGPAVTPTWEDYNQSKKLPELLRRSADVFVSWRYIFVYEHEEKDYQYHQFEYCLLVLACEALKTYVLNHEKDVL